MQAKPKILIADDDKAIVELLRYFLKPLDCEILTADDGEEALHRAQEELPDVVLLDVQMPKRSGWDVCQALKAVNRTSKICVVLMTARGDVKDRLTGLQLGADDYLVKPLNRDEVIKRLSALVATGRRHDAGGPVSEEAVILQSLLLDRATGLPTISAVLPKVREALIERGELGIIYLDIEQFEAIEAEYGWAFFDELVSTVGHVLEGEAQRSVGEAIVAANRPGGSSFYVFVLRHYESEEGIDRASQRLHDHLVANVRERFPKVRSGQIGFFVGATRIPYRPQIRLERQIYHGMRCATDEVRDAEQQRKRELTKELRDIIRRKRVTTLFQPIAWAKDCSVFGYEVLTRGPRNSLFRNSDMLFSFARESELLWDLEALALASSLERLRSADLTNRKFLINLEAEMFEMSEFRFHDMVNFFAEKSGHFVFELTERAAIADYESFRELLHEFRRKGIEIAIDDAGSGYASLEAIASLSPDYLKITKGLVSTVSKETIKQDLVKLLVDLAQKIGAKTIAEGIETADEYAACQQLGIDLLQGYYIAKPAEAFVDEVCIEEKPVEIAAK